MTVITLHYRSYYKSVKFHILDSVENFSELAQHSTYKLGGQNVSPPTCEIFDMAVAANAGHSKRLQ